MKKIAVIPARYAASRFPGKLMQMLGEQTVIKTVYENTVATELFDDVFVVTDSEIIYNEITALGGKALYSQREHECGSDRIAEAVENIDTDIVLNVQGDSPFVQKEDLKNLLDVFEGEAGKNVQVASLMHVLDTAHVANPSYVKVIVDKNNNSLYFSRSVIPYPRSEDKITYYKHIGVYAFRKETLLQFTGWQQTALEIAEKIECIRYLEHGIPLKMVLTNNVTIEIDTPQDLKDAEQFIRNKQ